MIAGIASVVLEVDDQERAKTFWTTTMGFEAVVDTPYGEERWLEVRAPDGTVLVLGRSSTRPGDRSAVPDLLPTTNFFFYCDDILETHRILESRGVEFTQPPVRQTFGWWSRFLDPDGNRHALVTRDR